ncbi:ankyrin repeat protein [Psychrobacter sp. PL19]|uniref:ankyrin repeat domain-containing protein n=1 Tax=Psychrobacter sp. PL19 TaxID=2760711 RepID=UPI002FEF0D63
MKLVYKMSASVITAAMLLTGCSSLNTDSNMNKDDIVQASQVAPIVQTDYRFSAAENFDIANKDKLSYRMFYNEPSKGADAKWFDAIKHGDLATVKYMANNGQDLEVKDTGNLNQTALGWAAFIGYEDIVDYLINQGASLQATDKGDVYNVLKSSALGKNTNVVKKVYNLLNAEKPVDLNDQTLEGDGETLIMVAASNNRLETVKYLLSKGANPNLVATTKDKKMGSYNQGAYSYACTRGHVKMQQLLSENGAINHRTGKASCE